jgi:hypothetical protein
MISYLVLFSSPLSRPCFLFPFHEQRVSLYRYLGNEPNLQVPATVLGVMMKAIVRTFLYPCLVSNIQSGSPRKVGYPIMFSFSYHVI